MQLVSEREACARATRVATAIFVLTGRSPSRLPYQKVDEVPEWILAAANGRELQAFDAILAWDMARCQKDLAACNAAVETILAHRAYLLSISVLTAHVVNLLDRTRIMNHFATHEYRDLLATLN